MIFGSKPITFASVYGHLNVLRYLIEIEGVDCNEKDGAGNSPIHTACINGNLEIVKYLIEECGADKDKLIKDDFKLITYACYLGHLDIVKYLIEECGVDKNESGINWKTLIELASQYGKSNVVSYLNNVSCFDEEKNKFGLVLEAKNNKKVVELKDFIRMILLARGYFDKKQEGIFKRVVKKAVGLFSYFYSFNSVSKDKKIYVNNYPYCKDCIDLFNLGKKDVFVRACIMDVLKKEVANYKDYKDYNDFYNVMINLVYKKRKVIKDFEKVVRGFGSYQINDNLGKQLFGNKKVAHDVIVFCEQ